MARPVRQRNKWRIRWVDAGGRRRSAVYNDYKVAQRELARRVREEDDIKRGVLAPTIDKTVADLCDYWIENKVPQKRSGGHDRSIIECHLRPALGHLSLSRVGVAEIDAFVVARQRLSKKTVHNLLTLLISLLNVALDLGWIPRVPRIKKPRVRTFDRDYSYLRTKEEMRRFLVAARGEGDAVFTLYATALYTGLREGELAGLTWADIDFERRLITVQRSYDGPTKSDDVRYVPILDALLPILRAWRLRNPLRIVFPGQTGSPLGRSARVFQEVFHRVLDRASFARVARRGKQRHYIVFHDLRHTFASHWVMDGGDLFKLQKILGHKTVQMTQRYAHLQPTAFQGDHARLGSVVATGKGNVLPLKRTATRKRSARSTDFPTESTDLRVDCGARRGRPAR